MRSPWTANDDQPGPIGRRHNSAGGDLDQSVSIWTPRITPSRLGPRKPGQIAGVPTVAAAGGFAAVFAAGADVIVAGSAGRGAGIGLSGVTGAGAAGADEGAASTRTESRESSARARSRSSGVSVHRQCRSEPPSPLTPPVRRSVNTPHARK